MYQRFDSRFERRDGRRRHATTVVEDKDNVDGIGGGGDGVDTIATVATRIGDACFDNVARLSGVHRATLTGEAVVDGVNTVGVVLTRVGGAGAGGATLTACSVRAGET